MPALVAIADDEGPKAKPAPTVPNSTAPPRTTLAPGAKLKSAAPESDDEMPGLVGISDDEGSPAPKPTPKTAPAPKAYVFSPLHLLR